MDKEKETKIISEEINGSGSDAAQEKKDGSKTASRNVDKNKKMLLWGAVIVAVVLIGGALYFTGNLSFLENLQTGKVVASVNDEKITRKELDVRIAQNKTSYESQGVDLSDSVAYSEVEKEALEFMINEELILQDAAAKGIVVTDEDIDSQVQGTIDNFEDEQAFETALKENGLTRVSLKENLRRQLTVQKYFDETVDAEAVVVTEVEINEFYDEYSAQNSDAPTLEEVGAQIRQLLEDEKVQKEVEKMIKDLREKAEVVILL